jgi:hypothetical protein
VNSSLAQDQFSDGIWLDSGEPDVVLGRILAQEYGGALTDPLPEKMMDLLLQLDDERGISSAEASPSSNPRLARPSRDL